MTKYLCIEFEKRFGKKHAGKTSLVGLVQDGAIDNLISQNTYPHLGYTDPAQAMPAYCKDKNVVVAYRNYYNYEKWKFASWNRAGGTPPPWWAPQSFLHAATYIESLVKNV